MQVLPAEYQKFIDEHINSVDQLEILRVLSEDPEREWGMLRLSKQIQSTTEKVAADVASLQSRGLLKTQVGAEGVYARHGSRTAELEELVRGMLEIYRQRPVTMIRLVYERANARLKAFADAFKLRKDV